MRFVLGDPAVWCQEGSPLKLKTYQAWTMAEALAFVKTDLGADAVILHTRTFERGGFFGIGRRSVVEITAARAKDIPRPESRLDGPRAVSTRSEAMGDRRSGERAQSGAHAAARGTASDLARGAAAARAYGSPVSGASDASGVTEAGEPRESFDPEVDREKTRRLAQAMAIALEKQAGERSSAARNEDAVREAALARMASQSREQAQRVDGPAQRVDGPAQRVDGPAQRFVLVPQSSDASGAQKLTAAVVRVVAEAPATAATAAVWVSAPASPAPSISPTHSSIDTVRAVVESKPIAGEGELDAISEFVGRVLKRGAADGGIGAPSVVVESPSMPSARPAPGTRRTPVFERVHTQLIEQDVSAELAGRIMEQVARRFETDPSPSEEAVRAAALERIAAILPNDAGDSFEVGLGRHGPRRIALVGPTGVGKTTTLAKIAANLKLKRGLRVGIVAADTYRIAAVDQLRTYAEILGLPVEVASSPRDAARACGCLNDVDVILIDTAGRSQNDHMKISELRAFLASAEPDDTHLVLSATASARTLAREAEAFGALGIDRIVLTKLDEAASFGTLVSLVERLGKSVSFFTHGQEVPDHIEVARSRRLAALVLGSEVR
jgi:flagellar biosynthesis protein FlhF